MTDKTPATLSSLFSQHRHPPPPGEIINIYSLQGAKIQLEYAPMNCKMKVYPISNRLGKQSWSPFIQLTLFCEVHLEVLG